MRAVLSISTTKEEVRHTRRQAKERGFNSVSEYVRCLVRLDEGPLITEDDLLQRALEAEKERKAGKLRSGKSIAEFISKV